MSPTHISHDDKVRIVDCRDLGLGTKQISERTKISPRTIRWILARHREQGTVENKKFPGKTKLTEHDIAKL